MSIDANDGSLDGLEDSDAVEVADANRPYGEVTAEDLDTRELVYDGADAATMVPDDPAVAVDTALHTDDPGVDETIEDRLPQEEPDPVADVAYGADASDSEGGLPDEPDATASDEA